MKEDLKQFEDLESLSQYVNIHSNKYTKEELLELVVSLISVLPYELISTDNYADDDNDARYIMDELTDIYGEDE